MRPRCGSNAGATFAIVIVKRMEREDRPKSARRCCRSPGPQVDDFVNKFRRRRQTEQCHESIGFIRNSCVGVSLGDVWPLRAGKNSVHSQWCMLLNVRVRTLRVCVCNTLCVNTHEIVCVF